MPAQFLRNFSALAFVSFLTEAQRGQHVTPKGVVHHVGFEVVAKRRGYLCVGHLEKCPDEPEPGQRMSPGFGILAFGRS